jgi:hypothetical protein
MKVTWMENAANNRELTKEVMKVPGKIVLQEREGRGNKISRSRVSAGM